VTRSTTHPQRLTSLRQTRTPVGRRAATDADQCAFRSSTRAHPASAPFEVDHIIPKCPCNAGKRDTDRTTFADFLASYQHRQGDQKRVLLENELALCIADAYPVSEGAQPGDPQAAMWPNGLELHQPEWNRWWSCSSASGAARG